MAQQWSCWLCVRAVSLLAEWLTVLINVNHSPRGCLNSSECACQLFMTNVQLQKATGEMQTVVHRGLYLSSMNQRYYVECNGIWHFKCFAWLWHFSHWNDFCVKERIRKKSVVSLVYVFLWKNMMNNKNGLIYHRMLISLTALPIMYPGLGPASCYLRLQSNWTEANCGAEVYLISMDQRFIFDIYFNALLGCVSCLIKMIFELIDIENSSAWQAFISTPH